MSFYLHRFHLPQGLLKTFDDIMHANRPEILAAMLSGGQNRERTIAILNAFGAKDAAPKIAGEEQELTKNELKMLDRISIHSD